MHSSSTDRQNASLLRLGVVLVLAAAALLSPVVGTTSAQFTDSTQVSTTIRVSDPQDLTPLAPSSTPSGS